MAKHLDCIDRNHQNIRYILELLGDNNLLTHMHAKLGENSIVIVSGANMVLSVEDVQKAKHSSHKQKWSCVN